MTAAALTLAAFSALALAEAPAIHPETLAPLVTTESRLEPYAVGNNCDPRQSRAYATRAEAEAAIARMLRSCPSLDIGVTQINTAAGHMQRRGLPVTAALDPRVAIRVGGEVLLECWTRATGQDDQARLRAALGCYNTGKLNPGAPYVQRVQASAEVIVPALRTAAGPTPDVPSPPPPALPAPEPACAPSFDSWALALCRERQARARRRQEAPPADPQPSPNDQEEYP